MNEPIWRRYLRFFGPDLGRDIDDELTFHLAMRREELEAGGLERVEAEREALRRFGSVPAVRLSLKQTGRRWERKTRMRDSFGRLGQDVAFAFRQLARAPGFTAVAVITLALGIGVNASIYSVIDGVLLRTLPYENAETLVRIHSANEEQGQRMLGISDADFEDIERESTSFEVMSSFDYYPANVSDVDRPPTLIPTASSSPGLFETLRVTPALGRPFTDEDHEQEMAVVIISHRLWQSRYGGDSATVGRALDVGDRRTVIIGVMPAGFAYPADIDIWRPAPRPRFREGDNESADGFGRDWRDEAVIARLKPGVTVEHASLELGTIAARLEKAYPRTNANITVWAQSALDYEVRTAKTPLLLLLAAVGAVLLIACANVANLLLARGNYREQEMAVRAALGAGRGRLARQLLTESVVLAVLGGLAGVILGYWALQGMLAALPTTLPRMDNITLDSRVIGALAILTLITGTVVGTLPALKSSRPDLNEALKAGSRGTAARGRHRIQHALVIAEIALSTVLVVSAALLASSFIHMIREQPGFHSENVIAVRISKPAQSRPPWDEFTRFFNEVHDRVSRLPGVSAAALSYNMPMEPDGGFEVWFQVPGLIETDPGSRPTADIRPISPGFFETVGMTLLRGRSFTAADTKDAPGVVVVNETFATRYFGEIDPIGYRIEKNQFWGDDFPADHEIVGIVGDVKADGLGAEVDPAMYFPYDQTPMGNQQLIVRTQGDPTAAIPAIQREVWAVDPNIPLDDFQLLQTVVRASVAQPRFAMQLVGIFALLALALAAVGIYGVMSYSVSERTKEMGLRRALGAEESGLVWLVLRQGLILTAAGLTIGLLGAWFASRLLSGVLFGVSPTDPITFALVAIILAGVALLACYLPARRATLIDPMVALRSE